MPLAWMTSLGFFRLPKNSLVQQYRKLVRFHGADLMFTDAAIEEIARIALARGREPGGFHGWSRRLGRGSVDLSQLST